MKILIVGLNGAIGTTVVAGVRKYAENGGAVTGSILYSKGLDEGEGPPRHLGERLGTPGLNEIEFAGWDVQHLDSREAAARHDVLEADDRAYIPDDLRVEPGIVGDTTRCDAPEGIEGETAELLARVDSQIREMTEDDEDAVVVWLGSTEASTDRKSIDGVASRIYARAALQNDIPFINGSPQNTLFGDLLGFAHEQGVPVAGRDLKTGQTLVKSVLASMLAMRRLGLEGWFSTNILGNSDGKTLQDDDAFASKENSKLGLLGEILNPDRHPSLYEEGVENHEVNINYYPPKGDNKEGWDHIDLFGWMDYSMQLKVNFLCRDSILAAPLVLDLATLTSRLQDLDHVGPLDSLGFYFKDPVTGSNPVEHQLGKQYDALQQTIRAIAESQ